ncbi:MAG: hypothetical protein EKK33_02125 [Bradyrhizobiaceae bacterium]|nr:MAG: hypothetical protein EKK33_02125 [Bradyrhizobiaceae bacterium]
MGDDGKYFVLLNGRRFEAPSSMITGIQLRLLGEIPATHVLIAEGLDNEPDQVVTDTDILDLSGQVRHVFAKPPTAFGSLLNELRP